MSNFITGTFGTPPKAVLQASMELVKEIESSPDLFSRTAYKEGLKRVRAQLAEVIGAEHVDECLMVPNVTTALNTVLKNLDLEKGDVIFGCKLFSSASKLSLRT